MKFSLIIPAYNAEATIAEAIESVMDQAYDRDDYEIVVCDNNSKDSTAEIIKKYPVKYLNAEIQGASSARNTGAEASQGDWLIFMDSDCVADKNLIASYAEAIDSEDDVNFLGGNIIGVPSENPISKYITERKGAFNQRERTLFSRPLPFVITANSAFRRATFQEIGGFDESILIVEDKDICWRLLMTGHRLKYIDEAIVLHKHRTTLTGFIKMMMGYGYGYTFLYKKYGKNLKNWPEGKLNIKSYLSLSFAILKLPQILLMNDSNSRWRLFLEVLRESSYLAGKMVSSIRNRIIYL